MTDALLDYDAAAKRLGVSVSFLEKQVKAGTLTPTRLGRRVLFSPAELARFVAEHTRGVVETVLVRRKAGKLPPVPTYV